MFVALSSERVFPDCSPTVNRLLADYSPGRLSMVVSARRYRVGICAFGSLWLSIGEGRGEGGRRCYRVGVLGQVVELLLLLSFAELGKVPTTPHMQLKVFRVGVLARFPSCGRS